jgi:hypothetical protein
VAAKSAQLDKQIEYFWWQARFSFVVVALLAVQLGWNAMSLMNVRRLQQDLEKERQNVPTLKLELGPIPVPDELLSDLQA